MSIFCWMFLCQAKVGNTPATVVNFTDLSYLSTIQGGRALYPVAALRVNLLLTPPSLLPPPPAPHPCLKSQCICTLLKEGIHQNKIKSVSGVKI